MDIHSVTLANCSRLQLFITIKCQFVVIKCLLSWQKGSIIVAECAGEVRSTKLCCIHLLWLMSDNEWKIRIDGEQMSRHVMAHSRVYIDGEQMSRHVMAHSSVYITMFLLYFAHDQWAKCDIYPEKLKFTSPTR